MLLMPLWQLQKRINPCGLKTMENEFAPPRRNGIILQGGMILALATAGGYFFLLAVNDSTGVDFLLHMVIALVLMAPLPLIIYRLYALLNGVYYLRRDGLLVRWGLRREDIPLNKIEWIRPAGELGFRLPVPWLRWPGAIIGSRKVPELGQVEFIAADAAHMILVATPEKVYAISPVESNQFMSAYRKINEMGSLSPLAAQSVYPTILLGRVWEDRLARLLILISFVIGIILLGVVSLAIPSLEVISWIVPGTTAPAERLLLLPILMAMIWLINMVIGILLFRRGKDLRIAAYLLWGNSALTGLILLAGGLLLIF